MSEQERKIALFTLSKSLVKLLGEEQAIADLTLLYDRHPEMFRDKEEVREVIDKVVNEPEIIIHNPSKRSKQDYIVAKQLNEEKMGDVGIRNDKGTNIIFHANKKRMRDFYRLKKISELDRSKDKIFKGQVVGMPISYTQAQSLDGRLVQKNISPDSKAIATDGGDAHSLHTAGRAYTGANGVSSTLSSAISETIVANGRDVHTPYTQAQSLDGRLVQKNISSATSDILTQQSPITQEELQRRLDVNLRNLEKGGAQNEQFLSRANDLAKQAREAGFSLDSQSLKKLEAYNKNLALQKGKER